MRCLLSLLLLCVSLIGSLGPAWAEKRVALVIGNANYRHVARLDNPANDARLMADTLRKLGFALVGDRALIDVDKTAFDNAVRRFGQELQGADVGLFYYAGHGLQLRGNNYLVPVGANPTREADIDFETVDTTLVLRQMEAAGTRLNLVILDACRNNPFGGRGLRSANGGLAQMVAPEGTLISFATQPGNVALDGSGANSPFTRALAQTIQRPGLDIFRTFNDVGLAVKKATAGAQQPWVSSSPIAGNFYFVDKPASPPQQPGAGGQPPSRPGASASLAERAWDTTKDSTSIAVFEEFVREFGDTVYGRLARARLQELREMRDRQRRNAPAPPASAGPAPSAAAAPFAPAAPPAAALAGAAATVQAFYQALAAGDGEAAARWVIPEKRRSGPFSARAMTRFYGSLAEPLKLIDVETIAPDEVRARYTFASSASSRCDGVAIVRTQNRRGQPLISSIKALNGC
jgi:hypothetical protein